MAKLQLLTLNSFKKLFQSSLTLSNLPNLLTMLDLKLRPYLFDCTKMSTGDVLLI